MVLSAVVGTEVLLHIPVAGSPSRLEFGNRSMVKSMVLCMPFSDREMNVLNLALFQ